MIDTTLKPSMNEGATQINLQTPMTVKFSNVFSSSEYEVKSTAKTARPIQSQRLPIRLSKKEIIDDLSYKTIDRSYRNIEMQISNEQCRVNNNIIHEKNLIK